MITFLRVTVDKVSSSLEVMDSLQPLMHVSGLRNAISSTVTGV
jgi:hypothetical protein